MPHQQQAIYQLTHSIIRYLEQDHFKNPGAQALLNKLGQMDLSLSNMQNKTPQKSRHDKILTNAISGISSTPLMPIASSLRAANEHLQWREDDGLYYNQNADLGDGYRNCNLHSLLIGPDACGFQQADFNLGVFVLGTRTLYRDHRHAASELYINLSERSGWRLSGGDWRDYSAGSIIWNAPNAVHATRAYEKPFISVFAWLENIHSPCVVVPRKDWETIELALNRMDHPSN